MAVQLRRTRRLAAVALAAAGCAAAVALAGGPTPPKDIRETFPDAEFVLALPAGGGAWTLWSGTMDDRPWLALSAPRAANVGAANCPLPSKPLTVCWWGPFGRAGIVVGRVTTRVASVAVFDGTGRRLRSARRGNAYLAVAAVAPRRYTVVARDRKGRVVRRIVKTEGRP